MRAKLEYSAGSVLGSCMDGGRGLLCDFWELVLLFGIYEIEP